LYFSKLERIFQPGILQEQCTVVYLQHLHVASIEGEHRTWLAKVRSLTGDVAFAECFHAHDGMRALLDMLVADTWSVVNQSRQSIKSPCSVGEALELLIDCIERVGLHSTLHDWTTVEERVVNCVVGFVNGARKNERDALRVSAMHIIDAMLRGWCARQFDGRHRFAMAARRRATRRSRPPCRSTVSSRPSVSRT